TAATFQATTTVRRRAPASDEAEAAAMEPVSALIASGLTAESRDDVAAVGLERLLLALGQQVDVPLFDAGLLEAPQLLDMGLGRTEDAEALAGLVADLLA